MKTPQSRQAERIKQRRERERYNLFARFPAVYAASRLQSQKILRHLGKVSTVEWRVLWDLIEAGPMTIRDMAEIQRIDHSQLSRALPAMRTKGLVTMERNDLDGRQVLVSITPEGEAAYAYCASTMKRRRESLKANFTEQELETFVSLIDRLEDFLRQPVDSILESDTPK